jgi:hypothetical protein
MNTVVSDLQISRERIAHLKTVLSRKGFKPIVLQNEAEVIDFINNIPNDGIVGLGDSITTCALKIRNLLTKKGSIIFYSWDGADDYNRTMESFEGHPKPDFYLTRINAITTKGEILIKDYSRKAAEKESFPKHVIAFAGVNRIVDKFNESDSLIKYTVIKEKPEAMDFTVVLLPFMSY